MMRWRERLAWLLMTAVTVAGTATACSHSAGADLPARAARPAAGVTATQCPAGQSPACAAWQDTNTSGPVVQDLLLLDHNGSPIYWCNNAGGCWVGNDRMGVTGSSVTDQAAYLSTTNGTNGELVIDGQVITAKDIEWIHDHGG